MTPADCELLRRYAHQGDQTAFAEVVNRHTDFVYSAAVRVTNNPALAEDVTQAVFTELARAAVRVGQYPTIIGWLHSHARHRAMDVVRGEERRRAREQEAVAMQEIPAGATANAHWEELRSRVDETVGQLRADDQQAVLLRFFKNLNYQEVGENLGVSEDTARKRVDRALEKLRAQFARRGVTTSSALLGAAITENSLQAAPVGLAARVAAASLATVGTATVGTGLLTAIFLMSTKTKVTLAMVVVLALAGLAILKVQSSVSSGAGASSTAGPQELPNLAAATTSKSSAPPAKVAMPTAPAQPAPKVSMAALAPAPIPAASDYAGPFIAEPKSDLNVAIATAIHYIESKDTLGFLQTMMPPDALATEGRDQSMQAMVDRLSQDPGTGKRLNDMLAAMHAITDNGLTPGLNDDGTRATYHLDPPVDGHKVIIFNKIGGLWYLDGM